MGDVQRMAYSAREVAEAIGVHYQTLLKEIKSGKLAGVVVGNRLRFTRVEIDRYLANCKGGEGEAAAGDGSAQVVELQSATSHRRNRAPTPLRKGRLAESEGHDPRAG